MQNSCIGKMIQYISTVMKHKYIVFTLCAKCGLIYRGLVHDMSKFGPTEFSLGVRYFQKGRSTVNGEREQNGYSMMWLHHKGCNKHHWEYWTEINGSGELVAIPMPKKYLVEMVCDRIAASMVYLGKGYTNAAPYNYFMKWKDSMVIEKGTKELLGFLLHYLNENTEEKTILYIRKYILQKH